MNNAKEIRARLDHAREQVLELETEIQNSKKTTSSQYDAKEIRQKIGDVRDQLLELEKEIQYGRETASSQDEDVLQAALRQPGLSLTEDQISLASAIVQQASHRIHDLRLFAATEYSDTEIEAASRSFVHQGRKSYLDTTRTIAKV